MRKPVLAFLSFFWMVSACSVHPAKPQKKFIPAKVSAPEKPVRVLAEVQKMEIPRIEKRNHQVRVHLWALRPDISYGKEEIEVYRMETGYGIKIWLEKTSKPAKELAFFREVEISMPQPGGYDIEAVGKSGSLVEIVFIDER